MQVVAQTNSPVLFLHGIWKMIFVLHRADIRKHPVYIRAVVDGATHEAAVKAAMDVNAGCDRQAATKLLYAFDSAEGLEKQERPDHEGEGQVNPPDAAGKTIAVNLSLYGVAAYQERLVFAE